MHLGMVMWDAGEPAQAREMVLEALRLKVRFEEELGQAMCLTALAWFSIAEDDPRRGATLAGSAEASWRRGGASSESVGALRNHRDASLERLRHQLSDRALAELMGTGAQLTPAQALDFAAGIDRTVDEPVPQELFEPLTAREWQVAQRIAEGLGNRQIAGRLAISPRTVDAHVAHILEKLAFGSRTQVAAWATERVRGAGA
jgi:DNA-binding CsgD family transcriptional regulator